jgi:hypothetical protein
MFFEYERELINLDQVISFSWSAHHTSVSTSYMVRALFVGGSSQVLASNLTEGNFNLLWSELRALGQRSKKGGS